MGDSVPSGAAEILMPTVFEVGQGVPLAPFIPAGWLASRGYSDAQGVAFFLGDGSPVSQAQPDPSPVALPGTLGLMAAALMAFVAIKIRGRRA
ncbi:MAG: hypothetical protein DI533_00335 [Cereibacter sphaeroides]|uniref:Uncharacterized protein n=1 Tax=Cereibacter sphaeroides TaxID=1063 RepID=A0A2W5UMU1_CERSP|nr:MAG: hypothetical protein DI533_00335 [Cereibacter sphaeroides]